MTLKILSNAFTEFLVIWIVGCDFFNNLCIYILKELLVDDKNIPNDDEVLSFINNKENKNIIINWGKDAAKRGSFGVPTMFVATGHMYFGNDRMPLLQRRLDIETGMLSKDDKGMTMWSKM